MTNLIVKQLDQAAQILIDGGVAVIRTDTLYGLVARADQQLAVERIYSIKQRTPTKPPIILVASTDQFFDSFDQATLDQLNKLWPGKISIILPAAEAPQWLQRGSQSLAYRIPADEPLRALLALTGPLIAPSANPEGQPPAANIDQARDYFGDLVDIYVDGGDVTDASPSRLYRLDGVEMERLR